MSEDAICLGCWSPERRAEFRRHVLECVETVVRAEPEKAYGQYLALTNLALRDPDLFTRAEIDAAIARGLAWQQAAEWNRKHCVGTPVTVARGAGGFTAYAISGAWVQGEVAVIAVSDEQLVDSSHSDQASLSAHNAEVLVVPLRDVGVDAENFADEFNRKLKERSG